MSMRKEEPETNCEGVNKIKSGADAVVENLASGADSLRARVNSIEEQLREAGSRLFDSAKELGESADKQVHLHPFVAIGAAFIVGALVTRAWRH
mgnify:CR=1 FL=1